MHKSLPAMHALVLLLATTAVPTAEANTPVLRANMLQTIITAGSFRAEAIDEIARLYKMDATAENIQAIVSMHATLDTVCELERRELGKQATTVCIEYRDAVNVTRYKQP